MPVMGPIIGELLPYAIGIAISPVPIIAAILMLLSPRARTTGTLFLVGWFAGILVSLTIFTLASHVLPTPDDGSTGSVAAIIRIVLGVVLVGLAVKQWRARPHGNEEASLPAWISSIDSMKPGKSLSIGFLLAALNPKNIIFSLTAGLSVGTAGLTGTEAVIVILVFTLIASATVSLPVIAYLLASTKMQQPLEELRGWLTHNNNTIMAVLFVVLGFVVLGKGISGL
jgi:threonine/homoserine/homoserine lactone efflux protein